MWVARKGRKTERGRGGNRVCERDEGLFYNMLFVIAASQGERGERGQNAGKTGFSEPRSRQPGEGRTVCLYRMCAI